MYRSVDGWEYCEQLGSVAIAALGDTLGIRLLVESELPARPDVTPLGRAALLRGRPGASPAANERR